MISRTITIAASPPVQIVLYFKDMKGAQTPIETSGLIWKLKDDFGQQAFIANSQEIISDVITDLDKMHDVESAQNIAKIYGIIRHEKECESQPMVKEFIERKSAQQLAAMMARQQGGVA
jgi:hypothetical protein